MSRLPILHDSQSSPLIIAEVCFGENQGRLGLTLCPGKKDHAYGWDRDLAEDLRIIRKWGTGTVLTLVEDHEFQLLDVLSLGDDVLAMGMSWFHLPIRDVDVPDDRFEAKWLTVGPQIHRQIDGGERVLIHCRGGIGRTGLVAALILVERGCPPRDAIHRVRAVRRGAIETRAQENYVLTARQTHGIA